MRDSPADPLLDLAIRIARNERRGAVFMAVLLATAIFSLLLFYQQLRIADRDHIISRQGLELSVPAEDSIHFSCTHCGWPHKLELKEPAAPPLDEK